MDRRDALKMTSLFLGYSLVGTSAVALLNGCKAETTSDWSPKTLSNDQSNLLAEVCESIFPKTDTPGAKDALCHRYIDELLTNFYSKDKQSYFLDKLSLFDKAAKEKFDKKFVDLDSASKEAVLAILSAEAKTYKDDTGEKPHIFSAIKEATISGYFSSEVGATGGLCAFVPIPGPYQGCIDYATVGKAFVLN